MKRQKPWLRGPLIRSSIVIGFDSSNNLEVAHSAAGNNRDRSGRQSPFGCDSKGQFPA
jgi:hypothetical protein